MPTSRVFNLLRRLSAVSCLALGMVAGCAAALPPSLGGAATASAADGYVSPEQALQQGIAAYKAGQIELALHALEAAAASKTRYSFFGQFFLARVLSDNSHRLTDHNRAYDIYIRIADEYTDVDPDEDQRAAFVAKALLALATYTKSGVPEIGLPANPQRAAQFVHQAATVFSDEDAQFELAKLFLTGDGIELDVRRAIHWLSVLSQRGHPGAQAYLADIYWRGRFVPKDQRRALILITLALETAPTSERIWMEDIYQNVFCGSSEGVRSDATGQVADWRQKYGRSIEDTRGIGLAMADTPRTCSDGRRVPVVARKSESRPDPGSALTTLVPVVPGDFGRGTGATVPLMDVGARVKPQ